MNKLFWGIVPIVILFSACKKDSNESLSGNESQADFTFVVSTNPSGDTLPFQTFVKFTNTSKDAHAYQWDFGDTPALSTDTNPTHVYTQAGTYTVKLTSVGGNGYNSKGQLLTVSSSCDFAPFQALTACGSKGWSLSSNNDAISIIAQNGTTVVYSGAAENCQGDDLYTFRSTGAFDYDAKGQTFVAFDASAPYTCKAPRQNAKSYYMLKNIGGNPKIVLRTDSTLKKNPFIGTTDSVVNNTYEVISVDNDNLVLQAQLLNGQYLKLKLTNGTPTVASIQAVITGGSTRTWRLDSSAGANAIVVGTEAEPAKYYGGGALSGCQKKDEYTFSTSALTYLATSGSTQDKTFNCGADRSFTAAPYTYGAITNGTAGLAVIGLSATATPDAGPFIGIVDHAPENVYRVLSISSTSMVLRSGYGQNTGIVHTMKFVRK